MAHLWFRDADNIWSAMPLNGAAVDVSVEPPRVVADGFRSGVDTVAAVIRAEPAGPPVWMLLATGNGDLRVNGFRPIAGLRVLQDRDEIRLGLRDPLFFSAETLACVEEFPGSERACYCGRCRQPLEKGQLAVQCPQCKIWFHQGEALPCWAYAPSCAFCLQSTLDTGFDWVPEA
jgi:hypothetical protein